MPNWVFNSLVVSGDKSELEKMVAQLNQPFEKHFPEMKYNKELQKYEEFEETQIYSNPVFSFWNIQKPTDLEAYYGETVHKKVDNDQFMKEFVRAFAEEQDWYHWNVRNWGTKWDVAVDDRAEYPNTTMSWTDDDSVMYHFDTAWSPVDQVLTKLSKMYPDLDFDYEFEEEQGWGGKAKISNGDFSITDEWDIPESHSDYAKLDRECNCDSMPDDPEYWWEDCPADTTKYELIEGNWQEKTLDSTLSNSVN